jgi:hypothetical protein
MKYWIIGLLMAAGLIAGCGPELRVQAVQIAATDTPTPFGTTTPGDRIGICHSTGSTTNPWVYIVIDSAAIPAHQQHGDIFLVTSQAQCGTLGAGTPVTDIPTGAPAEMTATATATATATGTLTVVPAGTHTPGPANAKKVGICHRTGSANNPYVYIVVSKNAVKAHRKHGDIVNVASAADCPTTAVNNANGNNGNSHQNSAVKQKKDKDKQDKDKGKGNGKNKDKKDKD